MSDRLPMEYVADQLAKEESIYLNVAKFEHVQRVAKAIFQAKMWPDHIKTEGDAIITLNLSGRLKADPFMIAQSIHIIHGKPGFEGKLINALVNSSGLYSTQLDYEWSDSEGKIVEPHIVINDQSRDFRGCRAFATDAKSGKVVYGPKISWDIVYADGWYNKNGSKWKTMPELMFMYRAGSWFCNAHCAGVKLGMHTVEELRDIEPISMSRLSNGSYQAKPSKVEEMKERIKAQNGQSTVPHTVEDEVPPSTTEAGKSPHPWDRENWIKLHKPGYADFVYKHRDTFTGDEEAIKKWKIFYPDKPCPLMKRRETVDLYNAQAELHHFTDFLPFEPGEELNAIKTKIDSEDPDILFNAKNIAGIDEPKTIDQANDLLDKIEIVKRQMAKRQEQNQEDQF